MEFHLTRYEACQLVAFSDGMVVLLCVQGNKVLQMLQSGAAIYVAGSANKMPADVLSAFEDVIAKETGWPQESVSRYMRDLERKGRYVVEAWS